ncbi:MAG TPA: hypothetical protein DDX02_06360 [Clostridiaceae bacterium]|nr:hypothetical protein [Clostridiaceae bacterium]HBF77437.1 hypothetical protein [Clostridiaceae bacterium]HBG38985.1 hypothetical protein [Clostridiaceae bacterium]HBN29138.1 hypothetical protein [Clostridiaceae bacterium]HCL50404.1 hypothetical protein [Clostridiaceae bacterium]
MINGIPIYINQDLVSDLTALMFGGFEESRNVRNREEFEVHVRNTNDCRVQATMEDRAVVTNEHHLGKVHGEMEFLKDVNSTIIFTDFSRFNSIRDMLLDKNMIKQIREKDILDNKINCCEYVEFTASMTTTSLLSSINTLIGVIESYDIKILDNLIRENLLGITNVTFILNQLKFLSNSLSMNNTTDIVLNMNPFNVVLTVNLNAFSNKNAYVYDLAHSKLRVLGKVSRIVDGDNYFDLLRKTATSDYYNRFLTSLAPYLSILNNNGILVPDKFITKVNGPGLNVIPVAIYV